VAFPVEDGALIDRLLHEILAASLADNAKAHLLQPDGRYVRPPLQEGMEVRRSQSEFIGLAGEGLLRRELIPAKRYPEVRLAPRPPAMGEPLSQRPGAGQ